jgi:hypothetical protein
MQAAFRNEAQEKTKSITAASFSTGFRGVSRRGGGVGGGDFFARLTTSGASSGGTIHLGPFRSPEEGKSNDQCMLQF